MKPNIYIIPLLVLLNTNVFSQTQLPYYTGFDNTDQQLGWQLFRKGSGSNPPWGFATFNAFSMPNQLGHFYPVGGTLPTDDWFVSPLFDFSDGARIDSVRHNFSGFGIPNPGDSIAIYLLNGSPDPDLATSKTKIFDYTANYLNDNVWHLDTNILIPSTTGQSYIALRYTTINNWLDVQFDNIAISDVLTGVPQLSISENDAMIYPTPFVNKLNIENTSNESFQFTLYNFLGKKIADHIVEKKLIINLSDAPNGIYFYKVTSKENLIKAGKMIKQ